MGIAHLPTWDATPIEVALDLEHPRLGNPTGVTFSGSAEPRICLLVAFALAHQLKRIVSAIDRALPARLPPRLRVVRLRARSAAGLPAASVSILPMAPLIRIQARLLRAIQPGLAHAHTYGRDMDETTSRYIHDFIPSNALPAIEPPPVHLEYVPIELTTLGVSVYRLDRTGKPQTILGHWAYAPGARQSIPLRSGP